MAIIQNMACEKCDDVRLRKDRQAGMLAFAVENTSYGCFRLALLKAPAAYEGIERKVGELHLLSVGSKTQLGLHHVSWLRREYGIWPWGCSCFSFTRNASSSSNEGENMVVGKGGLGKQSTLGIGEWGGDWGVQPRSSHPHCVVSCGVVLFNALLEGK